MISLKHEIKSRFRKFTYSPFIQNFFCNLLTFYIKLVYATCRKNFINCETFKKRGENGEPSILITWHGRILMSPGITFLIKEETKRKNFCVLASRHKDGALVSLVMGKFGFKNISGSSSSGPVKEGRGINISSLRAILQALKDKMNFAITPDGPRGPKHKIKGQVVNIAKISGVPIIPTAYSCSRNIILKSWDEFMIPLPFSKLYYYCEDLIFVDKNANEEEIERIRLLLEEKTNLAVKICDQAAKESR